MLKVAQLYVNEIREKDLSTWYNPKYMYYDGYTGSELTKFDDDNYRAHKFVSVDENNNVIGLITYCIDWNCSSVDRFGIICYEKCSVLFIRDVIQAIKDIFYRYNINRVEFFCYVGNPALKGYRRLVDKFGGKECGYYRKYSKLMDGKLHDAVVFEILKSDLKAKEIKRKEFNLSYNREVKK